MFQSSGGGPKKSPWTIPDGAPDYVFDPAGLLNYAVANGEIELTIAAGAAQGWADYALLGWDAKDWSGGPLSRLQFLRHELRRLDTATLDTGVWVGGGWACKAGGVHFADSSGIFSGLYSDTTSGWRPMSVSAAGVANGGTIYRLDNDRIIGGGAFGEGNTDSQEWIGHHSAIASTPTGQHSISGGHRTLFSAPIVEMDEEVMWCLAIIRKELLALPVVSKFYLEVLAGAV